jgi:hypothetical protein
MKYNDPTVDQIASNDDDLQKQVNGQYQPVMFHAALHLVVFEPLVQKIISREWARGA